MLHTEEGLGKCVQSIACLGFIVFGAWRLISMQQPQFDLLSQLQQHPMCRWPICTGLLALLVGLSVINCGTSAPARVFGRRLALAEWQRDARRADEPAGVTHWQPSTVDLGKRCGATSRRGQMWHMHAGAGQPRPSRAVRAVQRTVLRYQGDPSTLQVGTAAGIGHARGGSNCTGGRHGDQLAVVSRAPCPPLSGHPQEKLRVLCELGPTEVLLTAD